ncbi:hypothetical protein ACTFIZ_005792 [Dictyostelium cf. discoideum]
MARNSEITLEQIFKEGRINLENDDYNCVICSFPLFDGLQCKRGHGACKSCWEKIIGENGKKECHSCRISIKSLDDLSKNLYLEKEIFKQKVSCLNNGREKFGNTLVIKSDGGCKRQDIPIEKLLHHIKNECGYLLIDCKYSRDCKYYKQISLEQHQNECQFMSIHCPGLCGKKDLRMNIIKHLETPNSCKPLISINNSNSNNYNNNNNNNNNNSSDLNGEAIIKLSNQIVEIQKVYQKEIKTIKENSASEIAALQDSLYYSKSRIKNLEDELEELKDRFSNLESMLNILDDSTTSRSGTILINGWKMKLKSLDVGDAIVEEEFYIGTNRFYLRVYPFGDSYDNQGYVTVKLGRIDGEDYHLDIGLKVAVKGFDMKKKVLLSYYPGDIAHNIDQLIETYQTSKEFKIVLHFKVDLKPKIK